jgi:hypothetical protein
MPMKVLRTINLNRLKKSKKDGQKLKFSKEMLTKKPELISKLSETRTSKLSNLENLC